VEGAAGVEVGWEGAVSGVAGREEGAEVGMAAEAEAGLEEMDSAEVDSAEVDSAVAGLVAATPR